MRIRVIGCAVLASILASPAGFGTTPGAECVTGCQSFIDTRSEIFVFTGEGTLDTRDPKGTLYRFT